MSSWRQGTDFNRLFAYPNSDTENVPEAEELINMWQDILNSCWDILPSSNRSYQQFNSQILATVVYIVEDYISSDDPDIPNSNVIMDFAKICQPAIQRSEPIMPTICAGKDYKVHCFIMLMVNALNRFIAQREGIEDL
jgi:hypothetical protein